MKSEYFAFLLCFAASKGSYLRQLITPLTNRPKGPSWGVTTKKPTQDPLFLPHFYWPNYGYEPYWADGDWIIRNPMKDLKPNQTTTKIPLVCGVECSFMHMRIKEVCAHRSDWYHHYGCETDECSGKLLRDLTRWNYKTFDTYCEFLDAQCRNDIYRWGLLHRGPCITPQSTYLKPLLPKDLIVSRMQSYLSTWDNTYESRFEKRKTTQARTTLSTPGG